MLHTVQCNACEKPLGVSLTHIDRAIFCSELCSRRLRRLPQPDHQDKQIRNQLIVVAHRNGATQTSIAKQWGISHTRVGQILRKKGALPRKKESSG